MKHLILATTLLFLATTPCFGQEAKPEAPSLEVNGSFDMYYQYAESEQLRSAGRAFDARNSVMQLNMAEVSLKKKTAQVQFRADIAFGEMVDPLMGVDPTAAVSTANADATKNIPQAYLVFTPANLPQLSVTAGKFYSYLGFEVTHAKDNWQYSRSYTYNFGLPFWHEGIGVAYAFVPNQFTATFYALNAWDGRIANEQNKSSTWGASLNFTPRENLNFIYNFISGSETVRKDGIRTVHELNGSYIVNSFVSLAFDAILGQQAQAIANQSAKWSAWALYAKFNFTDWYALSPRYEIFDDSDAGVALASPAYTPAAIGIRQKITAVTLSNNFRISEGLESRLELRQDKSDMTSAYFKNKDGLNSDHETTATLALLYSF